MEILVRHVIEVSPELAALFERLALALGRPARAVGALPADGAAVASSPAAVPDAAAGAARQNAPAAAEPEFVQPFPGRGDSISDAAAVPAKRVMGRVWRTEEREALLREMWPTDLLARQIIDRLAALPGPPMPRGDAALYAWAQHLALPTPRPGRREMKSVGQRRASWRTQARAGLLARLWPQGVRLPEIVAQLGALPGPPVPSERVAVWAAEMGAKRPAGFASMIASEEMGRMNALVAAGRAASMEQDGQQEGNLLSPRAPELPGASPAAAAGAPEAGPRAVPPAQVATPAPKPPPLPAPAANGKVYATFRQLRAWWGFYGQAYDGANIDRLNRFRAAKGLPEVVQDDTLAEAA